jgi:hypothetical protein
MEYCRQAYTATGQIAVSQDEAGKAVDEGSENKPPKAETGGKGKHATPRDDSFVPANKIRVGRFDTHSKFKSWLGNHPSVKRELRGQHLFIHAADYHREIAKEDEMEFAKLDTSGATGEILDGIAERAAELRKSREAKGESPSKAGMERLAERVSSRRH